MSETHEERAWRWLRDSGLAGHRGHSIVGSLAAELAAVAKEAVASRDTIAVPLSARIAEDEAVAERDELIAAVREACPDVEMPDTAEQVHIAWWANEIRTIGKIALRVGEYLAERDAAVSVADEQRERAKRAERLLVLHRLSIGASVRSDKEEGES